MVIYDQQHPYTVTETQLTPLLDGSPIMWVMWVQDGSGYPSMTGHSDDSPLQRIPAPNATFQSQEVRAARSRGARAVSPMSPVPGKPASRVVQNLGHQTTLIIPRILTG